MAKSPNLGLHLTAANDIDKEFLQYRTELSGTDSESNMMILDTAIGDAQRAIISNKQNADAKIQAASEQAEEDLNHFQVVVNDRMDAQDDEIATLMAAVGTPLLATAASEMTDHNKIYVYVGESTGNLVQYNWHYWDGEQWVPGGVYQSAAVQTDKTLSVENVAADAKKTGDTFDGVNNGLNGINDSVSTGVCLITGNTLGVFRNGYYATNNPDNPEVNIPIDLTNPSQSSTRKLVCTYFPCSKGDIFHVNLSGGLGAQRAWVILDANRFAIARAANDTPGSGTVTITQDNAAYFCVNNYLTTLPSGYYAVKGSEMLQETVSINENALKSVYGIPYDFELESGGISSSTGQDLEPTNTLRRTKGYFVLEDTSVVAQSEGAASTRCRLYFYDEDHVFLGTSGALQHGILKCSNYAPLNAYYFRVVFTEAGGENYKPFSKSLFIGTSEYSMLGMINDISNAGLMNFAGKNVAIIGDSVSTNGNYSDSNPLGNIPEIVVHEEDVGGLLSAYATYYDVGTTIGGHTITTQDIGTELTFTPRSIDIGKSIGKPKNNNAESVVTWWEVCMEVLGFNVIPVCWSGSSITSHEADKDVYATSYSWHDAQIRKCGIRAPGTMNRTAPDIIIIYRGANDMTHTPYTRITNILDDVNITIPETDLIDDNGIQRYGYIEGYLVLINKLLTAYPHARIILCTQNYLSRLSGGVRKFPTSNGINTLQEYNNAVRKVADFFGLPVIEFDKDGLNFWNASNVYYQDSAPNFTHPTTAGHKIMGNKALRDLITKLNDMN